MTLIFQRSIDTGNFPDRWKISYITPIFKSSGDKQNIKQYRPVCISSIIPKLFENLVSRQLYPILSTVIAENQHGFLKGKSTATNLVSFTDYVISSIQQGHQVDCIYTDFSKCFDRINHDLLIAKLRAIGVGGSLLQWFSNFHRNRKQKVKINANTSSVSSNSSNINSVGSINPDKNKLYNSDIVQSEEIEVTSGCIQGGHLSGILFLCFVNDIVSILPPDIKGWLYADDLKIAMRVGGSADVLRLQEVLQGLHHWCHDNLMELNIGKCKVMSFHTKMNPIIANYSINNTVLERVNSIRDLGVTMEPNLRFNTHYNNIKSKAFRMLGFLYRQTQDFNNPHVLKLLYYSYVRSHLEYCSVVWSPQYQNHIDTLESVQRKFLRLLSYKIKKPILDHDYTEIMSSNNIMTLQCRRNMQDVVFLYKILHNMINSPELLEKINFRINIRNTRSHLTFKLNRQRTNLGEFSSIHRMQSMGNRVGDDGLDIFSCTLTELTNYNFNFKF